MFHFITLHISEFDCYVICIVDCLWLWNKVYVCEPLQKDVMSDIASSDYPEYSYWNISNEIDKHWQ